MTAFKFGSSNSRYVTGANVSAFAVNEGSTGADSITVDASGYLISVLGNGIELDEFGSWNVNIQGHVMARDGSNRSGIVTTSSSTSALSITIGADGSVAGDAHGIYVASGSSATINNAGTITADDIGIRIENVKTSITNSGSIIATDGIFSSFNSVAIVKNTGYIEGDITLDNLNDTLTNSGRIDGTVDLGEEDDTLTNSGLLNGPVLLGGGNNKVTNSKFITGDIEAFGGNDTLTNSGGIGSVDLASGKNKVTNSGTIGGNVLLGGDDDSFVSNGKNAVVSGLVNLGHGNNTFSNAGVITDYVQGDSGNDVFSNSGRIGEFTASVSISLGQGNDKLTNSGTVYKTVDFFEGDDTLTNSGKMDIVNLGNGLNKATNSGIINELAGGNQSDTVTNSGSIGKVALGGGDDKYTGGAKTETVHDGNGADIYNLGGGNDTYVAAGAAAGQDLFDKADGGAGIDTYDASGVTTGLVINIDNIDHFEPAISAVGIAPAGSAASYMIGNSFAQEGIAGFENANGGTIGDVIFGNSAINILHGNGGNDGLISYGGNDELFGDDGGDVLVGGAGADILRGGSGTDLFIYLALGDSGVTKAKRDIIVDFEDGTEKIDLFAIDANSTVPGNDAFDYINDNQPSNPAAVNFTGTAGELRSYLTATGYMIEGDINGDSKADFSIEIFSPSHLITFTDFDFVL